MAAKKQSCTTKTKLLSEWQETASLYSATVSDLSRLIGVVSHDEYVRLSSATETARNRSREAQANLEAHIVQHRCEGNAEASAKLKYSSKVGETPTR